MPDNNIAIISSTARDLPEYRDEVLHVCLRMNVFPKMMEHLPALDVDAVAASLALVDKAAIYIGIFAHRYGYVPTENNPKQISITEMEYNRAVQRKIPRLIFLIDEDHPVKPADMEKGTAAEKLASFKQKLGMERVRDTFTTKEDLRSKLIHALGSLEQSNSTEVTPDLHPRNIISELPEPYIAHPYTLLQTQNVVGRRAELHLLTDWVTANNQVPADIRIFSLVAIGGMGKSALAWKWFNATIPNELPELAGRMWWSFYESDAHWENFIIRALAYVSSQSEGSVREMKSRDREEQLWRILDEQPFLIVLDGLERILLAYARLDAVRMLDDDLDDQTANRVAKAHGLPESASVSFVGKHQLRRTCDYRAGQFLRRLTRVKESRIVVTTRLYPAELQMETGHPLPNCFAMFLGGLTNDDALNLWREFNVTGSSEELLPLFNSFGNYPLLLRALAGEVAAFRSAPGDFDQWRKAHPDFHPMGLALINAKTHVLEFALRGLNEAQRRVLQTLAAFRMPATWETMRQLLSGSSQGSISASAMHELLSGGGQDSISASPSGEFEFVPPCADDRSLDAVLTELEDRGLIGWDKRSNRYDLHPIVRSIAWHGIDQNAQKAIYSELNAYFDAAQKPKNSKIESVDELTPAIGLFDSLIGLRRFDDACTVFWEHLYDQLIIRLCASQQCAALLEHLFPDGVSELPRLKEVSNQISVLEALGLAYGQCGESKRAVEIYERCVTLVAKARQSDHNCAGGGKPPIIAEYLAAREQSDHYCAEIFHYLSFHASFAGQLRLTKTSGFRALEFTRAIRHRKAMTDLEAAPLVSLADVFINLGYLSEAAIALKRAVRICSTARQDRLDGWIHAVYAKFLIAAAIPADVMSIVRWARRRAIGEYAERDFISAARLRGTAALALNQVSLAGDSFYQAASRAENVNLVQEILPALIGLAQAHARKGEFTSAREFLERVWEPAERGPYPLFHADALNVLAQIERDHGNREAAIAAATKAYTLAWCDGISVDGKVCYAYHYGLTNARKHLQELGAPEPQLPPFDESKFEPMPDVELNPKDEFWVDPDKLDSP
jgi:tetratricopeptide (TPR) repeat protein